MTLSFPYGQVDELRGVKPHGAVILLSKLYCMNNGFELHPSGQVSCYALLRTLNGSLNVTNFIHASQVILEFSNSEIQKLSALFISVKLFTRKCLMPSYF